MGLWMDPNAPRDSCNEREFHFFPAVWSHLLPLFCRVRSDGGVEKGTTGALGGSVVDGATPGALSVAIPEL